MSKIIYISLTIFLIAFLTASAIFSDPVPADTGSDTEMQQQTQTPDRTVQVKPKGMPDEHTNQAINCKSCHMCEYPTREDPCLIECPKESMITIERLPKEGPDVVHINEMSNLYSGVVFSHKLHAEMSVISTGCTGCHHYNTTGPILNCRKCHENNRARTDVSKPDLKAAYHRQCLSCHKQWSNDNGCSSQCHLLKGSDPKQIINTLAGKEHPKYKEPSKMVWETNYEKGKIVTFYHDEHVKLFKLECTQCHQRDNCTKCHPVQKDGASGKPVRLSKTMEEHHMPCNDCHKNDNCSKCHLNKEMSTFNHARSTGWSLSPYHDRLTCERCHGSSLNFKKISTNCTSCHNNFVKGSFDHKVTGLMLSEGHEELECKSCHPGDNFTAAPVCKECHENDITYPDQLPGKKR